jgi:asparagine synthase (glutamine-hydrolysing)
MRISAEDAEAQTREHLERAVARRLESEVPLGVLLSGGIDSSSIVAAARRHVSGTLRTFSIGFKERKFNELPFARQVAERYATEHQEFVVRSDVLKLLPQLVWHADEPFGDSSALPTYILSEMTQQRVSVALGGDGGDESFAGYTRYQVYPLLQAIRNLPLGIRQSVLHPLIRALNRWRPDSHRLIKLEHLIDHSLGSPEELYAVWLMIFPPRLMEQVWAGCGQDLVPSLPQWAIDSIRDSNATNILDQKMACDISTYLPGDLLLKIDRMSMAHGLEVRCPFLDRELMEFAAKVPAELKTPGGELKGLLKNAVRVWLPDELLDRPKRGFSVPLGRWFRDELRDLPAAILLSEKARRRGLFDEQGVRTMIEQHHRGYADLSHRLWTLMAFEAWAQTFLDPSIPPVAPLESICTDAIDAA